MDLGLKGRNALVTGSSKGIGLAIARSLAEEGCNVILAARTQSDLDEAAAQIRSDFGVEAKAIAADISKSDEVKKVAAQAGELDILVNCAGAIPRGTLLEIDEERWRKAWDLKLFGAINLTREIYGPMCERGRGVIINIAGLAAERPDAYYIAGSCANVALEMFSRSLGGDSIRYGVRVLAVNPGPVETEKLVKDVSALAKEKFGDPSRWREIMAGLPMKRAATTDEVASLCAFLASDRAGYISGASFLVDGGLLCDSAVGVKRG
jgi:NAD(P)-dependent dehydrogenase (short-subunit alcohol dehydrogenase family)